MKTNFQGKEIEIPQLYEFNKTYYFGKLKVNLHKIEIGAVAVNYIFWLEDYKNVKHAYVYSDYYFHDETERCGVITEVYNEN